MIGVYVRIDRVCWQNDQLDTQAFIKLGILEILEYDFVVG